MKIIDEKLLNEVITQAKESPVCACARPMVALLVKEL